MVVKLAFLNSVLNKEIYMEQPQGFITAKQENKVCQLKRALYGLKQASHTWNQQFHGVLNALGFEWTYSDAGIYVRHQHGGNSLLIVILYVDDITIMGSSLEDVKQIKEKLSLRYEMSDLGEIQSYLGMRICRDRSKKRIEVDQSGYIRSILDHFGMADANPHPTPLPAGANAHLIKNTAQATQAEIKHFQSLIGSLLYVQIGTRPDISFAVSRLAQYAANPTPLHCDNKGAIDLALNPVTGRRSKHIDIKYHVICGYIEKGYISLIHTPTEEMVADGFTKSLSHVLLHRFNSGMGLSA